MKVNDIINENINSNNLKELLENDFSQAYEQYKKGYKIYKGFEDNEPNKFEIMNPLEDRISRNTVNFYNLIINEAPWWKEFPQRNVICTTNGDYAHNFGTVYIIFPKNETKIGVCPKRDIWHNESFDLHIEKDNTYIDFLEDLSDMLGKGFDGFDSYKDLVDTVKKFDSLEEKHKERKIMGYPEFKDIEKTIIQNGLFNFIKKSFTPKNFTLTSTSNFSYTKKDHREVWFNNQFLAIHEDIMIDSGL